MSIRRLTASPRDDFEFDPAQFEEESYEDDPDYDDGFEKGIEAARDGALTFNDREILNDRSLDDAFSKGFRNGYRWGRNDQARRF